MTQSILTISLSFVYIIILLLGIRMVRGKLSIEYFYFPGASFWEINRIHMKLRPELSRKVGYLFICISLLSLIIAPLLFFGILDFLTLIIAWVVVIISFSISFFVIIEMYASKSEKMH